MHSGSRSFRVGAGSVAIYGVLAALATIASMANPLVPESLRPHLWALDLVSHHLWLTAPVAALCGVLLFTHRRSLAMALLGAALLGGLTLFASRMNAAVPAHAAPILNVVSANVHNGNSGVPAMLQWAGRQTADLLVLQEVTPEMADVLAHLPTYPHAKVWPDPGPGGLAILSKHPFNVRRVESSHYAAPLVVADLAWMGEVVTIVAVHPWPPVIPEFFKPQLALLEIASRAALEAGRPALVIGDMNATPWSAGYAVLRKNGLAAAPAAVPTWPVTWLGAVLPLDHVFHTPHWQATSAVRGEDIGSDHYPIHVSLALRSGPLE